jgi:hypothetical protein
MIFLRKRPTLQRERMALPSAGAQLSGGGARVGAFATFRMGPIASRRARLCI